MWYKKAKLIDKNKPTVEMPGQEKPKIHSVCQYCGRWATHPTEDYVSEKEDLIWKPFSMLNPEEAEDAADALARRENKMASHGICDYCWDILKRENFDIEPAEVTQESLQMPIGTVKTSPNHSIPQQT